MNWRQRGRAVQGTTIFRGNSVRGMLIHGKGIRGRSVSGKGHLGLDSWKRWISGKTGWWKD